MPDSIQISRVARFETFVLNLRTGELRKGGVSWREAANREMRTQRGRSRSFSMGNGVAENIEEAFAITSIPKLPTWRTLSACRVATHGDISAPENTLAKTNFHGGTEN